MRPPARDRSLGVDPLKNFDQLPDEAHVRIRVVQHLLGGCSAATIWRAVRSGDLPPGIKLTKGVTAWQVGALRRKLRAARCAP